MSRALDDVAAERQRQIESEGWSEAHDDEHDDRSLAAAGLGSKWCYYCGKDTHDDAECNSTRPKDWQPTCQPALTLCPTCGNDFRKCVAMRPNAGVTGLAPRKENE